MLSVGVTEAAGVLTRARPFVAAAAVSGRYRGF